MSSYRAVVVTVFALSLNLTACTSLRASSGEKPATFGSFQGHAAGQRPTQEELQANLLRFESQFAAGVEDANRILESSPNMNVRYVAIRNRLNYATNSLEIATGGNPETNLLDMINTSRGCGTNVRGPRSLLCRTRTYPPALAGQGRVS
jgi:hypothetical protein